MATLTKFPVTMPDGTEYRVKITEHEAYGYEDAHAIIRIYRERKRSLFGVMRFKRLESRYAGLLVYDPENPDYIALATWAIRKYEDHQRWLAARQVKQAETALARDAALRKFAEWDGKIT